MRISDWSSDVCSSDLQQEERDQDASKNRRERPECKAHGAQGPQCTYGYMRIPSTAQRRNRAAQQVLRGVPQPPSASCNALSVASVLCSSNCPASCALSSGAFTASRSCELGSASCRDRVCQDV